MNPDGTGAEIIGYNYRNSYEQSVTSLGDVFQNDNDDPPACRVSWVMDTPTSASRRTTASGPGRRTAGPASPFRSRSGARTIRASCRRVTSTAADRRPATSSTRTAASARPGTGRSSPRTRGGTRCSAYKPARQGAGFALERKVFLTSNAEAAIRRVGLRRRQRRPPRARSRRSSGRRTSPSVPTARCMSATGSTRGSADTRIWTTRCRGRSTGSRRRASSRKSRRSTPPRSTASSRRCDRPR